MGTLSPLFRSGTIGPPTSGTADILEDRHCWRTGCLHPEAVGGADLRELQLGLHTVACYYGGGFWGERETCHEKHDSGL